ncbi:hypothetical protein TUN199_08378 [Pyrenophora tritici-repentis]|nr:hypothetical protein TUN205_08405 [Pyrenophora tritici-repentis]KAI0619627.1 hypothetical protein TUN199_08378 [Pyrenophora tritici-repentis]
MHILLGVLVHSFGPLGPVWTTLISLLTCKAQMPGGSSMMFWKSSVSAAWMKAGLVDELNILTGMVAAHSLQNR